MNEIKMFIPIIGIWYVATAHNADVTVEMARVYQRIISIAIGLVIGFNI